MGANSPSNLFEMLRNHPTAATFAVLNALAVAKDLSAEQCASFPATLGYLPGFGLIVDPLSVQMPNFREAKAAGADARLNWRAEGEGIATVLVGRIEHRECLQIYVDAKTKSLVLKFV